MRHTTIITPRSPLLPRSAAPQIDASNSNVPSYDALRTFTDLLGRQTGPMHPQIRTLLVRERERLRSVVEITFISW